MSNESFFDEIMSLPGNRVDDFMDQTRRFQKGDIGVADQTLMGGANALGMLTDMPLAVLGKGIETVSDAVSSVLPEVVTKGFNDLAQGIKETEAVQAAIQFANENPQWMKRLGYVADLSLVPATRAVKTGVLPDLSLEAPNRQPSFYGSGKAGQAASILRTSPSALKDALNPQGAAARRQGIPLALRAEAGKITPERRQKAVELKRKGDEKNEEENNWLRDYKKDLSFLEGQLDQTQLLSRGRGLDTQNVVKSFENVQQIHAGTLGVAVLNKAVSFSTLDRKRIKLNKNNLAVIEEKIRKDQKITPNEKVEVVVRNPNAFSDITKESFKGPSKEATRVFYAREALKENFPDKQNFTDKELKEFVALTKLPDDTLYRVWGKDKDGKFRKKVTTAQRKKANRLERAFFKATESDLYDTNKKRSDRKTIEFYYKYKKAEQEGKKLTKPQQSIYDGMKARVLKMSESLDMRGDTVYFNGSHKSAAKGLGGVNDQFMVNKKGNFVHFMNDENDLFGKTVPGDSRVLSVVPPNGYNVFMPKGRTPSTPQPNKQVFQDELTEMGSPAVNKTKEGMLEQAAVGIQKQQTPDLQLSDFQNLAAASTLFTGASREQ